MASPARSVCAIAALAALQAGCAPAPTAQDAASADASTSDATTSRVDGEVDATAHDASDDVFTADTGAAPSCDDFPAQGVDGPLSILPGRRGFGLDTAAGSGRGGGASQLLRVTTLADSGPGSLRACVAAAGPRTCVFEVSGTITATSDLEIREPYLTLAGQTAPSPGITLRNATLLVLNAHDILVQHLRVRVGDDPAGADPSNRDALGIGAFGGGETHHVVLDHVSLSWATDEVASVWTDDGSVHDVSFVDSIVAEGLHCSLHPEGCHSAGLIIGRHTARTLVMGTLFAHNDWRNPLVRDAFDDVVVVNDLVFADGSEGVVIGDNLGHAGPSFADVRASELVRLPVSLGSASSTFTTGSAFFVDAHCESASCIEERGAPSPIASAPTVTVPGLVPQPVDQVAARVLAIAGARPADRDAVDARVVDDVARGVARLVDRTSDVGGWPTLAESHAAYVDPPDADRIPATDPYTGRSNPGYTARELYLHELARRVTCGR